MIIIRIYCTKYKERDNSISPVRANCRTHQKKQEKKHYYFFKCVSIIILLRLSRPIEPAQTVVHSTIVLKKYNFIINNTQSFLFAYLASKSLISSFIKQFSFTSLMSGKLVNVFNGIV